MTISRRPIVFAALMLVSAVAADAAPLTLTARAGLGGVVRTGRWVPVTVTVANNDRDVSGELVIQWGDAQIRRAVDVPAPSRSTWSFFIRTGDVRDSIAVRLDAATGPVAEASAPVRVMDDEHVVTVCTEGVTPPEGGCAVFVPSADLPTSYRGFDAADAVFAADDALPATTRSALALWREWHRLELAGNNAPAAGVLVAATPPGTRARVPLFGYLLVLTIAIAAVRLRRVSTARFVAVVAAIAGGSVMALAAGRSQPIIVRHASVVQAFAFSPEVIVRSRIAAEFPVETLLPLTLDAVDASVTSPFGDTPLEIQDDAGHAVVARAATFGATADATVEAVVTADQLQYGRAGARTQVRNASGRTLRDCHFPAAFAQSSLATFAPGDAVAQTEPLTDDDPVVVCRSDDLPLTFAHPSAGVITHGTTTVVLHLPGVAP